MKSDIDRINYLEKKVGLKNPEIVIQKLLINTILKIKNSDGEGYSLAAFTGRSDDNILLVNLSEPKLDDLHQRYFKNISKLLGSNQQATQKKKKNDLAKYDGVEVIKKGNMVFQKDSNIDFFDYLVNTIFEKPCYKYFPGIGFDNIKAARDKFLSLSTLSQIKTLNELMKLIGSTSATSKLVDIGLVKEFGRKKTTKNLKNGTEILFNSVTGFYSKSVFVVPED